MIGDVKLINGNLYYLNRDNQLIPFRIQGGGGGGRRSSGGGGTIGPGTLNRIAKFTPDGTHIGDSQIFNDGTNAGVGTNTPTEKWEINGSIKITDGTQNEGKDLVSDINGKGTWRYMYDVKPPLFRWLPQAKAFSTYSVQDAPHSLAYDGTNMWVVNFNTKSVSKVTPEGFVTNYPLGIPNPEAIAFDGTNMWVVSEFFSVVDLIKIAPDGITQTAYSIGDATGDGIAFDGTNMWISCDSVVVLISTLTGAIVATYPIPFSSATFGMAFDGINMWIGRIDDTILKVTPAGVVTTYAPFAFNDQPQGVAFDGTNMWVCCAGSQSVTKVAPDGTGTNYPIAGLGVGQPYGIAFDGNNMWILNAFVDLITKVDRNGVSTNYTVPSISGAFPSTGIAFDGTNMWITLINADKIHKIVVNTNK